MLTRSFRPDAVPHVAVEVVVSGQQQPARLGKGYWSYAADDVVVRIHGQLLISPDVEQPNRGVVATGGECVAVGKELQMDRIIRKMIKYYTMIYLHYIIFWYYIMKFSKNFR